MSNTPQSYLVRSRDLASVELRVKHTRKGEIAVRYPVQRGRLTLPASAAAKFAPALDALVANGTLIPAPGV